MGYGFVIDQRRCIGCHACTVACKAENEVPLGDFRTWVKYTEKGAYPEVRRHFTVLRCNHCDAAPCVTICPVTALDKRPDAIVDLDRDQCIGCRACMQACPYDALYLNEERGVAEKCHYCAHRTELGLEPACVIVCPEQAIIAGDVDDAGSKIAGLIRDEPTTRRRLDKGTEPRVWYVDALPESLQPARAAENDAWLWSDRARPRAPRDEDAAPPRDVVATLDVSHKPEWGWHVWAYLVTKNLSAGAMMIAPFLALLGVRPGAARDLVPEVVGLVFLAITNVLLIHDLGRPERFWKLLFQPNTKSWLVKGAWVLGAFGTLATAALAARLLGHDGVADLLRWITLPAAALTSGYSAWLFAQCRGRDLWIESGLLAQLVLRAAWLGFGVAMLLPLEGGRATAGFVILGVATALGIFLERDRLRRNDHLEAGPRSILLATFRPQPAAAVILLGAVTAALTFVIADGAAAIAVRVLALIVGLVGMFAYERVWIRAGQAVPNS